MSSTDRLERDLARWLAATARPATPDHVDEIVREAVAHRQRPGWTFAPLLPRPMDARVGGAIGLPSPRPIVVLAILGLLLVLALGAALVGSRAAVPSPFGRAANGLVAYELDGDIFTVNPATGVHHALTSGPDLDRQPQWSPDGTRLAFLRGFPDGGPRWGRLVVTDREGSVDAISDDLLLVDADYDSIAWAPDGRTIAVTYQSGGRSLFLVDARDGRLTTLPIMYVASGASWRPPDGRELLFTGGTPRGFALFLYALDDGMIRQVPHTDGDGEPQVLGWTPDGRRLVFTRPSDGPAGEMTHVVDVTTGDEVILDLLRSALSNDGTRIVALNATARDEVPCIAPIDGGACVAVEAPVVLPERLTLRWSPDDALIEIGTRGPGPVSLLPVHGTTVEQPAWAANGIDSWQRVVP